MSNLSRSLGKKICQSVERRENIPLTFSRLSLMKLCTIHISSLLLFVHFQYRCRHHHPISSDPRVSLILIPIPIEKKKYFVRYFRRENQKLSVALKSCSSKQLDSSGPLVSSNVRGDLFETTRSAILFLIRTAMAVVMPSPMGITVDRMMINVVFESDVSSSLVTMPSTTDEFLVAVEVFDTVSKVVVNDDVSVMVVAVVLLEG